MTEKNGTAGAGHNSGVSGDELKAFVDRIERVEDEREALAEDIRDIYAEAKSRGWDVKALRKLIRLRKKRPEDLAEENATLGLYGAAIGFDVFG